VLHIACLQDQNKSGFVALWLERSPAKRSRLGAFKSCAEDKKQLVDYTSVKEKLIQS